MALQSLRDGVPGVLEPKRNSLELRRAATVASGAIRGCAGCRGGHFRVLKAHIEDGATLGQVASAIT